MDALSHSSRLATEFMYKVYGWMSVGLAITAGTAYYVSTTSLAPLLAKNMGLFIVLFLIQLGLVIALSFFLPRLSYFSASAIFILYSALTGITFSTLFLVFTKTSLTATFGITAALFGIMALFGYFTKSDLTSWGNILFMILIGLIIGMVMNIFLKSSALQFIISAVGVVLFSLLTAYDAQQIKNIGARMMQAGHIELKAAIFGALTLYLDFINLFLMLLNFTGQRRD